MTKCDLSREERIKKYDTYLSVIDEIIKKSLFQKIIKDMSNSEFGQMAEQLVDDYSFVINSIKHN